MRNLKLNIHPKIHPNPVYKNKNSNPRALITGMKMQEINNCMLAKPKKIMKVHTHTHTHHKHKHTPIHTPHTITTYIKTSINNQSPTVDTIVDAIKFMLTGS